MIDVWFDALEDVGVVYFVAFEALNVSQGVREWLEWRNEAEAFCCHAA